MAHLPIDRPSRFPWPPVLLVGVIAAAVAVERWLIRLPVPFAETDLLHFGGMTLLIAGLGLAAWASLQFPRHRTSIRPDRGSDALVAAGPFAFSRNPIYLGEVMALAGGGLAFNRLALLVAAPLFAYAVHRLAITREEDYLERRFGTAYFDYKSRVRRWI